MRASRARTPRTRLVPVHLPGRLTASASLLLRHGAGADPPGREGTGSTWAVLLRRDGGAGERGARECFETGLEELGTTLTLSLGWQAVRLTLDSTPDCLADALALLARVLGAFRPTPQEVRALARHRGRALAAARRAPGGSAGPLLDAALFPGSRYGRGMAGDAGSAARVDADAVHAFHRGVLSAPRDLVVAADLARVDLRALVRACPSPAPETAAERLHRGSSEPGRPSPADNFAARVRPLTLRRRTGGGGCVVMLGVRATARDDAPLILEIARRLLVATASSRLSRALRDASALAYSVHGELWQDGGVCSLRLRFEVAQALVAPAAVTALGELFGLAAGEVDADDLRSTVEAYRRDSAATTGSPAAVAAAGAVSPAVPAEHPPEGLTPDRFRARAAELLAPERVAVVVDGALHGPEEIRRAVTAAARRDPPGRADALLAYARRVAASGTESSGDGIGDDGDVGQEEEIDAGRTTSSRS
ncbi:insulinase family protein [Streptomyces xinghaiensis]|uniref:insulinase family protein n=1 Tax=Streptomyces xinghaiensis TaxID=1038928 RepID=UPI000BAF5E77|nr:insulinase family protein [Streptomyces xinghaiensis]